MNRILCSTGAIVTRRNGRDRRIIEKTAPFIHCGGFEFLMYKSWYENYREITRELYGTGIKFPVFHVEKSIGELITYGEKEKTAYAEKLFGINCEAACILGAQKLVLHLWDGVPSDRNIQVNINEFAALKKISEEYGLLLTAENVPCINSDPLTHFAALLKKYPDISFTLDVRHGQFHGQLDYISDGKYNFLLENNLRHIHISDYGGGYMEWPELRGLPVGKGIIDFKKFFSFVRSIGYEGDITVESPAVNEDGSVDTYLINENIRIISEALKTV